jgi:hypothetical protein
MYIIEIIKFKDFFELQWIYLIQKIELYNLNN